MKRSCIKLKALTLLAGVAAHLLMAAPAVAAESSDESTFVALANQARAAAGMDPLAAGIWSDDARAHSQEMAASGSIFHDSALQAEAANLNPCWLKAGENVGRGGSVDAIHAALLASPSHRANILGDFDSLGIGIERTGDTIYVTQRFMKLKAGCGESAPVAQLKPANAKPPAPAPVRPAVPAAPRVAPVRDASAAAPAPPAAPAEGVLGAEEINDCPLYWCWFRPGAAF